MAQNSRAVVNMFADVRGLDPGVVRSIRLRADAKDAVLTATVVIYPAPLSREKIEGLLQIARGHNDQFNLVVEAAGAAGDDNG